MRVEAQIVSLVLLAHGTIFRGRLSATVINFSRLITLISKIIFLKIACLPGCEKCHDGTTCDECYSQYFKFHKIANNIDICVLDCGSHYYPVYTPIKKCLECDFRCLSCTSAKNTDCGVCDIYVKGVVKIEPSTCDCAKEYKLNAILKKCESNKLNI